MWLVIFIPLPYKVVAFSGDGTNSERDLQFVVQAFISGPKNVKPEGMCPEWAKFEQILASFEIRERYTCCMYVCLYLWVSEWVSDFGIGIDVCFFRNEGRCTVMWLDWYDYLPIYHQFGDGWPILWSCMRLGCIFIWIWRLIQTPNTPLNAVIVKMDYWHLWAAIFLFSLSFWDYSWRQEKG